MTLKEILALFSYSIPAGNGFNVECPAHVDNVASLSIADGKKGFLFKCQAGCDTQKILDSLGLQWSDIFHQNGNNNGSASWRLLRTYYYKHASGNLAYEVLKWETPRGKQFTIRWKSPTDGRWVNGSKDEEYYLQPYYDEWRTVKPNTDLKYQRQRFPALPLMLYRWIEPNGACQRLSKIDDYLLLPEGEKDVDRAFQEGLIATTNTGGANRKWVKDYTLTIDGTDIQPRRIVIIPDNDDAGEDRANRIVDSLSKYAKYAEYLIFRFPGQNKKGYDLSDWFDDGHTAAELRALIDAAFQAQATQTNQAASGANIPPTTPPPNPPNTANNPNAQPRPVKNYNTTDMGNAERFVDKFGNIIRYCSKLGKDGVWLIWDGKRWQIDERLRVHKMARLIVPDIYDESKNALTHQDKKRLFKWAIQTEGLSTRNNMVKDARPLVAIAAEDLDTHTWLLNCRNGTVDLKTGKLQPHSQADYITKMLAIDYDENAQCPTWIDFINTSQWDKPEMIEYLQKAVGYSLTGDVSQKCMFILHGPTNTGKSTFVEAIKMILGEYARKIKTDTLMWRRDKQLSNDIAQLAGIRFTYASEAEENERLSEAQIKDMTGGEILSARFLHAEFFEFPPQFKIWLSTNHKPKTSNDEALWERLKLIPFTYRIPEDQIDRKLKHKLKTELPGILKWAIDGCLKWQADGLKDPQIVATATDDYRGQMDTIGHFLDDCCELDDTYSETASNLYQKYKTWCTDNGERYGSQRAFGLKLSDRGLKNTRVTAGRDKGKTEWQGIRILPEIT